MLDSTLINKTVVTKANAIEGTVKAVRDGYCIVEDGDGFDWKVAEGEFVVIDEEERKKQDSMMAQAKPKRKKDGKDVVARKRDVVRNEVVVDLHRFSRGHDGGASLQRQLGVVRATLDSYKGKHGAKIVFIHGSGTEDRLRNEIVKVLDGQKGSFDYQDAPADIYRFHTAIKVVVK